MKILVCFKVVNDLDHILEKDWISDENNRVDVSYANQIYGCFDESALELALRQKDQNEEEVHLTALTVGGKESRLTKNLYAVGFDEIVHLLPHKDFEFASTDTARAISEFVEEKGGYDLVIMGRQTGAADSGSVPFVAAEMLNMPCFSQVYAIDIEEKNIRIKREIGHGRQRLLIRPPVLLIVGNVTDCNLRIPTLKQKLRVKEKEVHMIDRVRMTGEDRTGSPFLSSLLRPKNKRKCHMMIEESMEEKAKAVYQLLHNKLETGEG